MEAEPDSETQDRAESDNKRRSQSEIEIEGKVIVYRLDRGLTN